MLIERGADVNLQCPPKVDQKTALHFAAAAGNIEVLNTGSFEISEICRYNLNNYRH